MTLRHQLMLQAPQQVAMKQWSQQLMSDPMQWGRLEMMMLRYVQ